ncbi:hypothetical protein KFE25_001628 [Diacronema lutheri]|uniref:Uncharacterized protein n=1 Tax=Diacronema lutheri TaxID=2081491 RepID=A0A8J5XH10_DIALT|nr:hypothetical protein KFE25_001628 [Diacronema lutheri]
MGSSVQSSSLREAEARLTRARLDATDGVGGDLAGADPADVIERRAVASELDALQRDVAATSELVASLQAEAANGLGEVSSVMNAAREESWRLSAYMQLEALKEQILSGDSAGAMRALEALEAREALAAADAPVPPTARGEAGSELAGLRAEKARIEAELEETRRALAQHAI